MTDSTGVTDQLQLGRGYPRPQLCRTDWLSLDGEWQFAIDAAGVWSVPDEVVWHGRIRVPFAPEAPASGVHETRFFRSCWYRRSIPTPDLRDGQRLLLHFGAVDHLATVWLNDRLAAV